MIEPTDEQLDVLAAAHEAARLAYWASLDYDAGVEVSAHVAPAGRAAMAAALAIVERDATPVDEGLDLIDVVASQTLRCLVLQCTGCGWTKHLSPGGGGRALAHIVDLTRAHAREVDHG